MFYVFLVFFSLLLTSSHAAEIVSLGVDQLLTKEYLPMLKGKKIGIVANHTALSSQRTSTIDLLKAKSKAEGFSVVALFAPEHGFRGAVHALEFAVDEKDVDGIPIFALYGKTKRPTEAMLKGVDLIIYDIQDIGSRSYTYVTTLFYVMEEAAKRKIPVFVLDRPNPINGIVIDGPMMEEKWRSIVGYINVPYCHGMTVGELAQYFNGEYKVGCALRVIPMKGWKRSMTFSDTGISWMPTSPYVPEPTTPHYYPVTGILGELSLVNIGIGYTLPFKVLGAPWIDAKKFAEVLNKQKFPGVHFEPFYFKPFYGKFKGIDCQGVFITVTDSLIYKPVSTQYLLIGILKSLYPKQFKEAFDKIGHRREMFCKVNGTSEVWRLVDEEKNIVWKLLALHQKERESFKLKRKKYLIEKYSASK